MILYSTNSKVLPFISKVGIEEGGEAELAVVADANVPLEAERKEGSGTGVKKGNGKSSTFRHYINILYINI